jgi:hypothetical protein
MAAKPKDTILIATISAISAVVIAVITTYGTIAVSAPEAKRVKGELKEISDLRLIANLPIGTIVPSMLQPPDFAKEVGDVDRDTPEWVLADGQIDISTSRYALLTKRYKPPDLRGIFLRGMNEGRIDTTGDPEGNRGVGDYQFDAFKKHKHKSPVTYYKSSFKESGSRPWTAVHMPTEGDIKKWQDRQEDTEEVGGDETRPRNVAVYFYIKIN